MFCGKAKTKSLTLKIESFRVNLFRTPDSNFRVLSTLDESIAESEAEEQAGLPEITQQDLF